MPHHKWSDIKAHASPETIAIAERQSERFLAAIALADVLERRGITQEEMMDRLSSAPLLPATPLGDLYLESIRDVVEVMGGELRITAHFSDEVIPIDLQR